MLLPGLLTMAVVLAILALLPEAYGNFTWGLALDWTLAPVVGMAGCAMGLRLSLTEQLHAMPAPGRKLRVWTGALGSATIGLLYALACIPFDGTAFFPGLWSALSAPPAVVLAAAAALGLWGFFVRVRLVGILYQPWRIQGIAPPQAPTGTVRRFQTPLQVLTGRLAFYYLLLAGFLGLVGFLHFVVLHRPLEAFVGIWFAVLVIAFTNGLLADWPREHARALRMLPLRTARAGFALQGLWLFALMPILCVYVILAAFFGSPLFGPFLLLLAILPLNLALALRGRALTGGLVLAGLVVLGAFLPPHIYLPLAAVVYPLGALWLHRVIVNLRPHYVSPLEKVS